MTDTSWNYLTAALFGLAIIHTFFTARFERLAHRDTAHQGLWHLFGEVEAVFALWSFVLLTAMVVRSGSQETIQYLEGLNFTEPMFVFVIMVVAASKPVLQASLFVVRILARALPLPSATAIYLVVLSVVPLFGSFITEPAAMTLAALILRDQFYKHPVSVQARYMTLAVLFVNVSIGGTLTHYAAPPVLMVAQTWGWDLSFMFSHFGWKAALAVFVNALCVTVFLRRDLASIPVVSPPPRETPFLFMAIHLVFLASVVATAHHSVVFIGIFLVFIGFTEAYKTYQSRLVLRESLMVALFLAGLVILGTLQRWWLQDVLLGLDDQALFFGAMALTAITDNAALTYLGSLVQGVDTGFQYALVSGAVVGGGLTVIANAPNPAGLSILKGSFPDSAVSPMRLLLSALVPTAVAALAFYCL